MRNEVHAMRVGAQSGAIYAKRRASSVREKMRYENVASLMTPTSILPNRHHDTPTLARHAHAIYRHDVRCYVTIPVATNVRHTVDTDYVKLRHTPI